MPINPIQQTQGIQFGMSQAQANYWIHHLLPVLQQALADLGHKPERDGSKQPDNKQAIMSAQLLRLFPRSPDPM